MTPTAVHAGRYFKRGGWPTSKVLDGRRPADEQERAALVEALEGYISQERERMIR
jgi:hypothetical protein